MIFASDLDRTLIYSKIFVTGNMTDVFPVEQKDGEIISYISENTLRGLNNLREKLTFIPVTSRSLEQYRRLEFLQNNKYSVVANGGIILKNNEIDLNWQCIILSKQKQVISPEVLLRNLEKILVQPQIKSYKCCDRLFIYIVLKEKEIYEEYLLRLRGICKDVGYDAIKSGRKIYLIPFFLNKWQAVKYIMEIEGERQLIAAGDSILDLPMLQNAMKGFVPAHGELNIEEFSEYRYSNVQGIYSSEELLENIQRLYIVS